MKLSGCWFRCSRRLRSCEWPGLNAMAWQAQLGPIVTWQNLPRDITPPGKEPFVANIYHLPSFLTPAPSCLVRHRTITLCFDSCQPRRDAHSHRHLAAGRVIGQILVQHGGRSRGVLSPVPRFKLDRVSCALAKSSIPRGAICQTFLRLSRARSHALGWERREPSTRTIAGVGLVLDHDSQP